jgi:outer membrane protein TolC
MPRDDANQRYGKKVKQIKVAAVMIAIGIGLGSARESRAGENSRLVQESVSATKKLHSVIEAAWEMGPDLVENLSMLDAEAALDRSFRGVGSPYVQFQMEGIGRGFRYQPNAQSNIRLGTPFDFPWQFAKSRKLGGELDDWQSLATEAARLQVAQDVAAAWLRLAALEENIGVEERRLARMDRAVRLQSERFNLGEVAGMEVTQLELQRAQDASILRALQAERIAKRAAIRQLAGEGVALPELGDLPALADDLPPWAISWEGEGVEDKVQRGPYFSSLDRRTEKERLLRDLIGATAWGRPEIQVEWEHIPSVEGLPSFDAFGFNLSVPLPLGKRGGQTQARAQAEVRAATAARERGRRELVQRAEAAWAEVESATARIEETEPLLARLPQTERSLSEQFRLGVISYLIYIDGLARLDDLLVQRIAAFEALVRARLELAVLLGDPNSFPLPPFKTTETEEAN